MINYLIKHKAKINMRDSTGDTILIALVKNKRLDLIKILLNFRVKLNKTDRKGRTAFYWACKKNFYKIAKFLIE